VLRDRKEKARSLSGCSLSGFDIVKHLLSPGITGFDFDENRWTHPAATCRDFTLAGRLYRPDYPYVFTELP
jgi:hypothetical protein